MKNNIMMEKNKILPREEFVKIIKSYYNGIEKLVWENHNNEYLACTVKLKEHTHRVRLAKITQKKIGQFVSVWEKNTNNINQRFSNCESLEYLSIFVLFDNKKGVFVFPKKC